MRTSSCFGGLAAFVVALVVACVLDRSVLAASPEQSSSSSSSVSSSGPKDTVPTKQATSEKQVVSDTAPDPVLEKVGGGQVGFDNSSELPADLANFAKPVIAPRLRYTWRLRLTETGALAIGKGRLSQLETLFDGRFKWTPKDYLTLTLEGWASEDAVFLLGDGPDGPALQGISEARGAYGLRYRVRDATVRINQGSAFMFLGAQHVVWGNALILRAVDRINVLDMRRFYIADYLESRIAAWMMRVGERFGHLNLEMIVNPDVRFTMWPASGSEFALPLPPGSEIDRPPTFRLADIEAGASLTLAYPRTQAALTIHRGWSRGLIVPAGNSSAMVHPHDLSIGLDGSVAFGKAVLRAEALVDLMAALVTAFPSGEQPRGEIPIAQGTGILGLDLQLSSTWMLVVEALASRLDRPHELPGDTTGLLAVATTKSFWNQRVEIGIRAIGDVINPTLMTVIHAALSPWDNVEFRLESALFFGDTSQLFGAYHDRSRIALSVRIATGTQK